MDDYVPCEICDTMIPFSSYSEHLGICLQQTRITGFYIRQHRNLLHQQQEQQGEQENIEELDSDDEDNSDDVHNADIDTLSSYITTNSQVQGVSMYDFINAHFSGINMRVNTRQLTIVSESGAWVNIANPQEDLSYEATIQISDSMGRVEVGLSSKQIDEVSYSSNDKDELLLVEDDVCAICQENLMNVIKEERRVSILACNHKYCQECINTWLSKNKKCPVCMIDLEEAYCWGRNT
jgi:hypothetical protein